MVVFLLSDEDEEGRYTPEIPCPCPCLCIHHTHTTHGMYTGISHPYAPIRKMHRSSMHVPPALDWAVCFACTIPDPAIYPQVDGICCLPLNINMHASETESETEPDTALAGSLPPM